MPYRRRKSKHYKSKKTCRKVAYYSKQAARQALNEYGRERGCKRFYKWPHCDGEIYHLTSESI